MLSQDTTCMGIWLIKGSWVFLKLPGGIEFHISYSKHTSVVYSMGEFTWKSRVNPTNMGFNKYAKGISQITSLNLWTITTHLAAMVCRVSTLVIVNDARILLHVMDVHWPNAVSMMGVTLFLKQPPRITVDFQVNSSNLSFTHYQCATFVF